MGVVAGLLINPRVLSHDLVLLLIPAALVVRSHRPMRAIALVSLLAGYLAIDVVGAWSWSG